MKYLTAFNESSYYKESTEDELSEVRKHNRDNFTIDELSEIMDVCKEFEKRTSGRSGLGYSPIKYDTSLDRSFFNIKNLDILTNFILVSFGPAPRFWSKNQLSQYFEIEKFEDEWFIVSIIYPGSRGKVIIADQFDGLIQMIKDFTKKVS